MRILHYTLGLPPYRSGGLTKYSLDLMKEQCKNGEEVYLLYPGKMNISSHTKIKKNKNQGRIAVFELINPLPVSLLGGVSKPTLFTKKLGNSDVYKEFLDSVGPDVIHIHTLMGIHKEFFEVAKSKNIKVIFTSHDYYPLCPKVNLIDTKGNPCEDFDNGNKCIKCNINAYSPALIYFMQSYLYRNLKSSRLMKKLRKSKKQKMDNIKEEHVDIDVPNTKGNKLATEFIDLRNYYISILDMVDEIHFNSEVAKEEYERHLKTDNKVLPVTHSSIKDNRRLKKYSENQPLQIGFLGPLERYKGFPLLRESLLRLLSQSQNNWHLHLYGNDRVVDCEGFGNHFTFHGRYEHSELKNIFSKIDVLVIPSIWKETFGFIGLEALSHGVPSIVSSTVGFKDIIKHNETGVIVQSDNIKELVAVIDEMIVNRKKLQLLNKNICSLQFENTINLHAYSISEIYVDIPGEN
ncbi:glycosyltransferase [Priestia filamentosa]|uniref:glycosyltransferase n=1 Tax=Priestia filamentosa TaxID=1402861 RepID=UPI0039822C83